jgi:hypothetical protein
MIFGINNKFQLKVDEAIKALPNMAVKTIKSLKKLHGAVTTAT